MSVAFWSVDVTSKKAVEVQPPEGYVLNLQLAALSSGKDRAVVKASTLAVEGDELTATLCTLKANACEQFTLALVFGYDVPVKFSVTGDATVSLSGYYQPAPEDGEESMEGFSDEEEEEEEESEDEEAPKLVPAKAVTSAPKPAAKAVPVKQDAKIVVEEDSEDDEDEEEDSEEDAVDQAFIEKMMRKATAGNSDSEDSEDEEEDSEEESEDEAPPAKVQKTPQQAPKGTPAKGTPAKAPQSNQKPQGKPQTPNGNKGQQKQHTPGKGQKAGFKHPQSGDKRKR